MQTHNNKESMKVWNIDKCEWSNLAECVDSVDVLQCFQYVLIVSLSASLSAGHICNNHM